MKNFIFKSFLFLTACLVSLFLVEAGLRLLGFPHNSPFIQYDKETFWRMAPSQSFSFMDEYGKKATVTINSVGARGEEFPREKPEGEKRLITVGDSYTYGWGVDNSATYQAFLQKRLKNQGLNWRVVNLGCNGHTILHEIGMVKKLGLPLKPDLVLVGFSMTDFADIMEIDIHLKSMPTPGYNALKFIIRKTALGHLLLNVRTKLKQKAIENRRKQEEAGSPKMTKAALFPEIAWAEEPAPAKETNDAFSIYISKMDELARLGKEHGFSIIFLILPWGNQGPEELSISQSYRKEGALSLTEFSEFLKSRYPENFTVVSLPGRLPYPDHFLQDGHLNAEGNKKAANLIFEQAESYFKPVLGQNLR